MTQGYGPNNGQQPQWGQGDQNPQQPAQPQWQPAPQPQSPAQPQWQPASPAPTPAPGGYPGAPAAAAYPGAPGHSAPNGVGSGAGSGSGSRLAKLTQWMLILVAAVIVVRVIREIVSIVTSLVGNAAMSSGSMDNGMAVAGGGVIVGLLFLLVNGLVSLGLLVLSIMVAVQSTGRGRAGAIIVAATLVVSVIVYWIFSGIFTAVLYNAGDFSTIQTVSIISVVVEIVRLLVVFAGLIVGGLMARNWVKRNA
ncbi:hypothetical protein [Brachybacterium alimentarium]|uniref:hypothetical protein n=1 Tax=Brachybacterium alimentarium TaxID=47845 RepID=UPI000BB7C76B|nr:hypothetical protein [Brachybacterium alimentarium]PCC33096.1 hypothetical protein CIK71_09950 [Brachybacterium alimentarium]RCS76744.1 hypothetical protein CIK70_14190 [Brachybacterium alimentarium]RCS93526.1 hypothetical protein CIK69_01480 [Brachybacterium alimentarium]